MRSSKNIKISEHFLYCSAKVERTYIFSECASENNSQKPDSTGFVCVSGWRHLEKKNCRGYCDHAYKIYTSNSSQI